jgi:hypothetical protein
MKSCSSRGRDSCLKKTELLQVLSSKRGKGVLAINGRTIEREA